MLESLPERVQRSARRAHVLFLEDHWHPSLQFKRVHPSRPIFSARVAHGYRALAVQENDDVIWFWIGSHAEYDRLLSQSRFTLAEDAEDLAAYRERAKEPALDFESALKNLPR